jgi:hypothetical protein
VNFDSLPTCASSCIADGSFNYGCIAGGENCFCLQENLFNCPAQCSDPADVQRITDWYVSTCRYPQDKTAGIVSAGSSTAATNKGGKGGAVIQTSQRSKLHWYEILLIATAVLTVVAAAVCTVVICILNRSPKFKKWLDVSPEDLATGIPGVSGVLYRRQSSV